MKARDVFQLLLLAAIWGSSYLFLRIAAPAIGISMTMGLRITIAAVIMVSVVGLMHKLPDYKKHWQQYMVLGALNLVIPFALTTFAVANLSASISAILNASTPLFSMIISSLWLKESLSYKKLSGLFVGIGGLVIIVGWVPFEMDRKAVISLIISLLASFSYGLGAVYTRVKLKTAEPMKTATGQLTAAALLVLPLLTMSFGTTAFNTEIAIVILLLALLCTALGYALYFSLIKNVGSTNASLVTLLVPVFSLVWSILFLNEPLTPAILVGLILIMGSLKLVLASAR